LSGPESAAPTKAKLILTAAVAAFVVSRAFSHNKAAEKVIPEILRC
jgi:hypothetical protein